MVDFTGSGDAKTATVADMSGMMIGDTAIRERAARTAQAGRVHRLESAGRIRRGQ